MSGIHKDYPFKSVCHISNPKRLEYILNVKLEILTQIAANVGKYYYKAKITSKGKVRKLTVPTGDLKYIQEKIQKRILSKAPLQDCMYGSIKERDIKANARIHINQDVVVALDIKKCFPNTSNDMVCKALMTTFHYPIQIGSLLTRLMTVNLQVPQGSPTSSTLVNIVLSPLCLQINKYAKKNNLRLSIWVDDIIFSGPKADEHIEQIIKLIVDFGFSISNKKIKVMKRSAPQEVTGIKVNNKLTISRKKLKKYTDEIYGYFRDKISYEKLKERSILGKIEHVLSVDKRHGLSLHRIFQQLSQDKV